MPTFTYYIYPSAHILEVVKTINLCFDNPCLHVTVTCHSCPHVTVVCMSQLSTCHSCVHVTVVHMSQLCKALLLVPIACLKRSWPTLNPPIHDTPAMHTAAYQHHHKGQCTHNGMVHGWLPTIYALVKHCETLVKHCETLVKHCWNTGEALWNTERRMHSESSKLRPHIQPHTLD